MQSGLDHILIGASSLDAGIAAFEAATGVVARRGGKHPGRGTENAIVSLGEHRYLEIIAPRPDAPASDEFATALRALPAPVVVGWAVHVPDVAAAATRLQSRGATLSPPQAGSRITPTGDVLAWTTFEIAEPRIPSAPFFIHWTNPATHPSLSAPQCALVSFSVEDPDGTRLATLLSAIDVAGNKIQSAAHPRMRATIRCGDRTVTFEGSSA